MDNLMETICFFKSMGKVCVCVVWGPLEHFPHIGANKHHRQRKFVRRSTKRSVVQSTYELSWGWMMRRELRGEGLVGRVALATMARSLEGTRSFYGFNLLVSYVGIGLYFRWFACKSSKYNPLVVTRGALGNKSRSFCEAVN